MRAAHRVRRRWLESLEPWNVSPHEARALRAVADGGPARLSDLAERLRIAARSATEVVDSLEGKGLVRRTPSPTDRRSVLVEPTTTGTELVEEIAAQRSVAGAEMLAPLSPDEVATLRELLNRVLATDRDPSEGRHRH